MIVRTAGVLVDATDAGELAAVLGEHIQRTRGTPALRRLHAELSAVAASSVRELGSSEPVWRDVNAVAVGLGRSERSVRRWAAQGRVKAKKEGRSWLVATDRGEPIWRTGSSGQYRPR